MSNSEFPDELELAEVTEVKTLILQNQKIIDL